MTEEMALQREISEYEPISTLMAVRTGCFFTGDYQVVEGVFEARGHAGFETDMTRRQMWQACCPAVSKIPGYIKTWRVLTAVTSILSPAAP